MRRAILLVAVMITAVLVGSAAAYAQQPTTSEKQSTTSEKEPVTIENHSWNGYHWARQANPFTLQLRDRLRNVWHPILNTTSSDWSKSTVLDTTVYLTGQTGRKCPYVQGKVQVCDYTYGQNGWLGIASIYISGKHITQGIVKLNDTYFNTSTYNTTAWRNLVTCQEVGHTLGLGHTDENFNNTNGGTCMDYTNDPDGGGSYGADNQHPNQHDYDQLELIYEHVGETPTISASTASSTPPAKDPGDGSPGDDRRAMGREIFRTPDGRVSLHELVIDRENKKLTWVRWTEEEAARHKKDKS